MKFRRIIISFVAVILSLTVFAGNGVQAETISGSCGNNLTYTLDTETGVLTISGTGRMSSYDQAPASTCAPWYSYREYIKTLIIEDGVTSIGESAFYQCANLTSVSIADSVTDMSYFAFQECTSLESIVIPEHMTYVGGYAFLGCSSLSSVTLPEGLLSIGESAFHICSSLESITIPDSVTIINDYAFAECSHLSSITMPISCSVRENSFLNTKLEMITLTVGSGTWADYIYDSTEYMYAPWRKSRGSAEIVLEDGITSFPGNAFAEIFIKKITIPDSVTSIDSGSFNNCTSLKSVVLPSTITRIEPHTFDMCLSLNSITIPDNVTSIGDHAFLQCESLTSLILPDGVASIEAYAFADCDRLTSINIPDNVTSIGEKCFSGCTGLTTLTVSNNVTTVGTNAFENVPSVTVHCDHPVINEANKCGAVELNVIHYDTAIYTWADDYSTVHGKVCSYLGGDDLPDLSVNREIWDHQLIEETVNTIYAVTEGPFCTEPGTGTYTATFTNPLLQPQSKSVELDPIGHAYGDPYYTWAEDNLSVTGTRVCERNGNHTESETVAATKTTVTAPTCTSTGQDKYSSADFENPAFEAQTKTVTVSKAAHTPLPAVEENRVEPTCTAAGHYDSIVYCDVCGEEVSRETIEIPAKGHTPLPAVEENRVEPGCETTGSYDSVVYCEACGEEVNRDTITIPALGHTWGTPEWTWNEELTEASAKFTCTRVTGHTTTLNATITQEAGEEYTTIIASVTLDGHTYTDEKTRENGITSVTPVFTSCSMNTKGITLYLGEVERADYYELIINGGEPIQTSSLEYLDEVGRKAGTIFTYKFRAYDSETDKYSKYSDEFTVLYNPFTGDVSEEDAFFDAVAWAYNNGIVNGTGTDTFGPNDSCQRQHFAIMLWRFAGTPKGSTKNPFADLGKCNSTAKKAILWASGKEIIMGTKKGSKTYFKPLDPLTREQILIMLWRFAGKPKVTQAQIDALNADVPDVAAQCGATSIKAIAWAYSKGVYVGEADESGVISFRPKDDCTREQLSVFLQNYNTNVKKYKPQ